MVKYQIGIETPATKKTGIPARFATLSREALVRQLGQDAVDRMIDGGHTVTVANGTQFYVHSIFGEPDNETT